MSGPPPPPPQYTEEQEKPPDDWVPPPDLATEISNDPAISPIVKQSISAIAGQGGPPPPPTASGATDYDNKNDVDDTNHDAYETGAPPPAANYDYGDTNNDTNATDMGDMQPAANDYGLQMLSTGNTLEDLDNILRIYRVTFDDVERSKLFIEFWKKWDDLNNDQPKELLKIPIKVRGFLRVLPHITPYQADQIMKDVLSEGGLLSEPEYIERRYILKLFLIYEFGNIFTWIGQNVKTLKVWMFICSLTLSVAILTHIFVDFISGNVWRALLMEFMVPISILSTVQFVDTPFFACVIRVIIEDNCSALATIPGRIFFNILVVFFCLGSWETQDAAMLFASFLVAIMTFIIFIVYSRLMSASAHVRILTGSSQKLEQKFIQYDIDRDGVLNMKELSDFFKSFRQQMSNWQLEMMITQYDIQRDNGLRFEAMDIWFRKLAINAETRSQVLSAKSREFYGLSEENPANANGDNQLSNAEMEWQVAGLAGMQNQQEAHNLALAAMGAS